MPFSQIFPPSPSPTESIRLFYTSVSLLLSRIQGYCYHLSKLHIYVLVYCIGVFLSGLLRSSFIHGDDNLKKHWQQRVSIFWSTWMATRKLSPTLNLKSEPEFIFKTVVCALCSKLLQSCPTLCNTMDYSPPGSSVHGIFQARIWEWTAISSSKGRLWWGQSVLIALA